MEVKDIRRAPYEEERGQCHSFWHHCGRKGGGSFPFKHDEFVVYERSQLYPELVIKYRRKPLPQ